MSARTALRPSTLRASAALASCRALTSAALACSKDARTDSRGAAEVVEVIDCVILFPFQLVYSKKSECSRGGLGGLTGGTDIVDRADAGFKVSQNGCLSLRGQSVDKTTERGADIAQSEGRGIGIGGAVFHLALTEGVDQIGDGIGSGDGSFWHFCSLFRCHGVYYTGSVGNGKWYFQPRHANITPIPAEMAKTSTIARASLIFSFFIMEWTIAQWERMANSSENFPTNRQADKFRTVDHHNVTDGEGPTDPTHGFLEGLLGWVVGQIEHHLRSLLTHQVGWNHTGQAVVCAATSDLFQRLWCVAEVE